MIGSKIFKNYSLNLNSMATAREIYKKYDTVSNLEEHQLRVVGAEMLIMETLALEEI